MKEHTIGVLGIGEVGEAISQIFSRRFKVLRKDHSFDQIRNTKIEVLHVCIPYTSRFVAIVTAQVKKNKPDLVIIHSTVVPRTTKKIYQKTQIPTVHSPIMGKHPNLRRDIIMFVKFIGPTSPTSLKLAKAHLSSVGIKTIALHDSIESELGKLLDTTYYAWNIIFNKVVAEICHKQKVDFNNVYTKFNKIYNLGYIKTNPFVLRPILKYVKGAIGGHCIIPNTQLLNQFMPTILTEVIIKINKGQELNKVKGKA